MKKFINWIMEEELEKVLDRTLDILTRVILIGGTGVVFIQLMIARGLMR